MKTQEVINHLINLYREQRFAHAYLFETNDVNNCLNDIMFLINNIICPETYKEKCNNCNLCHLIRENNLPSLMLIKPDGTSIKKEAIESIKENFANKPIYTKENIYIIEYPEKMNAVAFNKLLKFLEEPEKGIIAFLITENKNKIASTIVSRCETIKMIYDKHIQMVSEKIIDIANKYINNFEKNLSENLLYNYEILQNELADKSDVIYFFQEILNRFREKGDFEKANIVVKYLKELEFNVNSSLLMDSFLVEMGNLYGK